MLCWCCSLPKLDSINLHAHDTYVLQPDHLVTLLSLLRTQLPRLRSLVLDLGNSCTGEYIPPKVWQQLGGATQLTGLELRFGDEVSRHSCHSMVAGCLGGVRAQNSSS